MIYNTTILKYIVSSPFEMRIWYQISLNNILYPRLRRLVEELLDQGPERILKFRKNRVIFFDFEANK
jgi:hypothetical protein